MKKVFITLGIIFIALILYSCVSSSVSAEELYSIGMAYFELGNYAEAEKWLTRARQSNRTMTASQYNLGRIAYEQQRYEEAARHFEDVLKKDPYNILALRAAAYTRIKTDDIEIAENHYARLLQLVPESADDGHNHALVLYAMKRYREAEELLERYSLALLDNSDNLLLYARCQAALNNPQAIDNYSKWLVNNTDPKVRHEYAALLEKSELYARALEEYRQAMSEIPANRTDLNKGDFIFSISRVLLIADSSSNEGVTELQNAVTEGFSDIAAVEELISDRRISAANRDSIRTILNSMRQPSTTN